MGYPESEEQDQMASSVGKCRKSRVDPEAVEKKFSGTTFTGASDLLLMGSMDLENPLIILTHVSHL